MKNISIIGKFLTIMAAFAVFAVGMALYSGQQISSISSGFSSLLHKEQTAALFLARSNRSLQATRASVGDLLMSRSDEMNIIAFKEIESNRDKFVEYIDTAIAAQPAKTEIAQMKRDGLAVIDATCAPVIAAAKVATSSQDVEATQIRFLLECQPIFEKMSSRFNDVTNEIIASADNVSGDLVQAAHSTVVTTLIAVLAGLTIILVLGFVAIRSWIVRPIQLISTTMDVLANGNLIVAIDGTDRRDEIGGMAKAVQVFKDNGLRAQALAAESESMRRDAEAAQLRTADADSIRAKAMAQATSGLGEALKHLSNGDLTFELAEPFATDFETLRADFNATVSQLAETLRAVADATGAIDNGSLEISSSANDLSKRTEQQAASLEETAAALDQITANVANSSRRADEAREVAVLANDSAARSGKVVANAVDAMQKIERSSNEIANIIGVIDEIAFQTNLLALNAGVEAARAGDAGKGFAVVAQEVRELAQRSATAAKEIKELIRNSSVDVQNGVHLVSETGDALKTIQGYIVIVNQHMDAIATSAKEQSVGLGEVNTAVNQMDQVTQQNAAMVEETSAAGATLANESGRLRELISQFQLSDSGQQSSALRQVASNMAQSGKARASMSVPAPLHSARRDKTPIQHQEWSEF